MLKNWKKFFPLFVSKNIYCFNKARKPVLKPYMSREKIQRPQLNKKTSESQTKYSYMQIGLYGLVFACCFAGIPVYRVFCQHIGLVGNYDKKQYDFKDKKIINMKKFKLKFVGQPQPGIDWQFSPVQSQVVVGASQTAIVFYRLYNKQEKSIVGFSTYNISPEEANIYFSKIQCFCFNQQMINPHQQLLLPLFFYLEPQINEDLDVSRIKEITVSYQFLRSSKQEFAKFAENQLRRVEANKRKLKQIRANKMQLTEQEYQNYLQKQETEENQMAQNSPKIQIQS